ncbi:MAG: aspartate-semialdehyde dehydrogenase, partial [Halobacteriovoraceae bacterium]|nr:aspartate-semialdehyde dehydrogenase [Halobacteriovoraceae bacterium]
MKKLGFIGWRGMVGSVLKERMLSEGNFEKFNTTFFSTSNAGAEAPVVINGEPLLIDAHSLNELSKMDILITCQGGSYSEKVYAPLRDSGWNG